MSKLNLAATLIVAELMGITAMNAQLMTDGNYHPLMVGARAAAMGDAYGAELSDISAICWNPGALPLLEHPSVLLDHYIETDSKIMNEVLAAPVWIGGEDAVAIGGSLSHRGYVTTGEPVGPRAAQLEGDIAYGREVSPGAGLGVRFSPHYIKLDHERTWKYTWAAGVAYNPSPEISYGVVYNDLLEGAIVRDSEVVIGTQLPRRLDMAITMRFPTASRYHVLTVSMGNEKLFTINGLLYKFGVEICPVTVLALRWGFITGPSTNEPRYGIGINADIVQLDYAISPGRSVDRFQQISITVRP